MVKRRETLAIPTLRVTSRMKVLLCIDTNAAIGVGSFCSLSLNKAATGYMLPVGVTVLRGAMSGAFNLIPVAAVKPVFTGQPANIAAVVITPAPQVTAQDAFGNTATGFTGMVVVALGANPSGGTLSGTTRVAAVKGGTSFANLTVDSPGTGYSPGATATALPG